MTMEMMQVDGPWVTLTVVLRLRNGSRDIGVSFKIGDNEGL